MWNSWTKKDYPFKMCGWFASLPSADFKKLCLLRHKTLLWSLLYQNNPHYSTYTLQWLGIIAMNFPVQMVGVYTCPFQCSYRWQWLCITHCVSETVAKAYCCSPHITALIRTKSTPLKQPDNGISSNTHYMCLQWVYVCVISYDTVISSSQHFTSHPVHVHTTLHVQ